MGFFRGKGERQEVTWWRSLRSALLIKLSHEKDQTYRNLDEPYGCQRKKKSILWRKKEECSINLNSMINLQVQTALTWSFLEDYVSFGSLSIFSLRIFCDFPPKIQCHSSRWWKQWIEAGEPNGSCNSDMHIPQWAPGQTASCSFWLSFHYFIITFHSIFP